MVVANTLCICGSGADQCGREKHIGRSHGELSVVAWFSGWTGTLVVVWFTKLVLLGDGVLDL
jgi:hypothetical protein